MSDRNKLITLLAAGLLMVVVVVVVLVSQGGDEEPAGPVVKTEQLPEPDQVLGPGETASVTMDTSEGSFTISLDTDRAPRTTNSFAYLVDQGFYDGLGFHRIVPDFVIQGGDPLGDGTGGPGYKVVEAPPKDLQYEPGVVAMAKSGAEAPGTSGSQFYVVTGAGGQSLTPEYALIGTVESGIDVVESIGALGGPDEQPTRDVVIEQATLNGG